MKYKIQVTLILPKGEENEYGGRCATMYEQEVEKLDLWAVIQAVNKEIEVTQFSHYGEDTS